ncbi:MAG TPA: cyclic nucleotide-binding domain-containing protein [Fibrobacteria bacterium]|nr:cyclic nucleotide-binding domain-containing protein [Fibrobacteria bacterium]
MLTLMDTPPFLEDMEKKAKQLAQAIARSLDGKGETQILLRESELLAVSPSSLIHILKGVFRCQHGDKTIRLYSSGDLLLSPGTGEAGGLSITSEFGAEIAVVGQDAFLDALTADRALLSDWLGYQNLETRIGHLLCSLYIAEEVKHEPELRQYEAGDVIIREDDRPEEVYEMITGIASVTSKGYPLSQIKSGEVFGELSFFTGLKRTATVQALEPCLVQVIDQQQLLRIMKYRPALVDGMIRTLCQRLVDLNVKLSGPK